jgi:cytochrome oxidase maturation protein, cbb3-type
MSVIYMLISISTIVVGLFLFLYLRAIYKGQYDDVQSPAIRMLFEDEIVEETSATDNKNHENSSNHKNL